MISPETRARVRGLAVPIALAFGRLGLTPNALTLIGFGIAILAADRRRRPAAGSLAGVLVVFGGVFDLFDGALARATGKASPARRLHGLGLRPLGRGRRLRRHRVGLRRGRLRPRRRPRGGGRGSAFMVSYARAKSESLGFTPGTGMANVGLAPREVRIVILTVGLILTGILGGTCVADRRRPATAGPGSAAGRPSACASA